MSPFEISLIILLVVAFSLLFFYLQKKLKPAESSEQKEHFNNLQQEINQIKQDMKGSLEKNLDFIQKQSWQTSKIIQNVTSKIEQIEATNKQVVNFADQLQNLQDILKNPKQRGVLGEYYLETTLKNVLPPSSYQMQYKFNDGEIVDAAIFVKDKVIPVDSKFSLENYNRIAEEKDEQRRLELEKTFKQDLKKRIDETSKYIRPNEKTMDFAFMFIPAEGVYYDLLINQIGVVKVSTRDLIEYAFKDKHVIIVSPTSFFAYLQTVLQGLRALQIEESAKEIRKHVEQLGKHMLNFNSYMEKMGGHLSTTVNSYNTAYKELGKIDKDIVKITDSERQIEPKPIDKPNLEQ